jgi:hypothetical protein
MSHTYTYDQIETLVRRIHKLKNEQHVTEIYDTIIKHNPSIKVTKNNSGYFMYFHNLTTITYNDIEQYLDNIAIKKHKKDNKPEPISLFCTQTSDTEHDDMMFSTNPNQAKLRFSNREINIIKRKQYDDIINNDDKDGNKDNSNIFGKRSNNNFDL